MTDDLLDEATRLAGDYRNLDEGRVLRALVERVQQADREAETQAGIAAIRTAERDEARGKLDKVRDLCDQANEGMPLVTFGGHFQSHRINVDNVLAILDGKTGD